MKLLRLLPILLTSCVPQTRPQVCNQQLREYLKTCEEGHIKPDVQMHFAGSDYDIVNCPHQPKPKGECFP